VKGRVTADNEDAADRELARSVLVRVFDDALRLLHPVVPFVTEALWQKLPGHRAGEYLVRAPWPSAREHARADDAVREFELVREAVLAIRQIRGDYAVPPGKTIDVVIVAPSDSAVYSREASTIGRLTRANVTVGGTAGGAAAHAILSGGAEVIVPLAGLVDVEKECQRLRGELETLAKQIASREQRLGNAKYVERAPPNVVESDRAMLNEMIAKREQITGKVRSLCGE
jgi:valyl-tRNA synthetase